MGFNFINNSYPKSLKKYFGRQIWETTIQNILYQENFGFFVKPKSKAKLFTGFIVNSYHDLIQLERFSKNTDLYCSTLVKWLSEYRVFVNNSKIVGVKIYAGEETLKLNMEIVEKAIKDFENSPERTASYGIDFGIVDNKQTKLIEWNDEFSLGSYGLDKEIYTDLLVTRWEEILKITSEKIDK